ncbi:hypothetical protein XELAEV_18019081mg [Xenopus laevis]|uniref:Secreted protein n=1 Tax=Xenopus laevis TaxID=8355 RepID=A0A974DG26_XENLA|nr:hypothetical protein XELAEV_18019081mg [Xenopus laevis]
MGLSACIVSCVPVIFALRYIRGAVPFYCAPDQRTNKRPGCPVGLPLDFTIHNKGTHNGLVLQLSLVCATCPFKQQRFYVLGNIAECFKGVAPL